MFESEIQAFIPLIRSRGQIFEFLFGCHGIPLPIATPVPKDVVELGEAVEGDIHDENSEKLLVTPAVERRIVRAVDVGGYDATSLHEHIVTRCRHCTSAHGIGVARVPTNLNRMC